MLKALKIEPVKSYFRITFENGQTLLLHPEIIYGRSLKEGTSYDEATVKSIIEENSEKQCFEALLKILRTRMHSTGELRKKLFQKKFSYSVIDKTIRKAVESGVTNDNLAAECYKNELVAKGYGSFRIKDAMQRKGFSKDVIDKLAPSNSDSSDEELENAQRVFEKKLAFLSKDKKLPKYKLKEKLFRFMQSKGYSTETILSLMKDFSD